MQICFSLADSLPIQIVLLFLLTIYPYSSSCVKKLPTDRRTDTVGFVLTRLKRMLPATKKTDDGDNKFKLVRKIKSNLVNLVKGFRALRQGNSGVKGQAEKRKN